MQVPEDTPSIPLAGPSPGPASGGPEVPWQEATGFAVSVALGVVGHRRQQLAEDIAQEALMRMCRPGVVIETTWQALLHTITTRLALNRRRDEATRMRHVRLDFENAPESPGGDPGPLDVLVEEELRAELASLMDQLDDEVGAGTRAIVDFRSKGVPWQEIAGLVDLAERTCRYREEAATQWLYQRLSLQETRGGQHE